MSFGSATLKPRYWSQVILETSIVTCAWLAVAARNAIRIIILIVLMTARFMIGLHRSARMTVYRWLHGLKFPAFLGKGLACAKDGAVDEIVATLGSGRRSIVL